VSVGKLDGGLLPGVMLMMNLSSVAVLWFGGFRIEAGLMQVGSLIAFMAYLIQSSWQ
jgi:ATP-binding cassette, subfamily B, multidrug efflux pump